MKVKITLTNGHVVTGILEDDYNALKGRAIDWILNDERNFIPLKRPDGKEFQLSKAAIATIAEEN